ncbi:MAG TPA: hypothetical protein VFA18_04270 [Gemmataceae bacterium]|nr:hypothetical protein [Gemmataceae bacterium]
MSEYTLDTDTATLLLRGHAKVRLRRKHHCMSPRTPHAYRRAGIA